MNGANLARALKSGKRVYGTLVVSTSPHWPAAVKKTGVDFVFIDTEHIAVDRTTLAWMCQTYRALDLAPVVRIPEPDPYQACIALDNGATGVLAPYVESAEEVRTLVGAVKLRPLKGRFLDDLLHERSQMEAELNRYVTERNTSNVLLVNTESAAAVAALDEILAVPGLDGVLVGPHDLSCSLGVPEQYDHPKFLEAVAAIIAKASARQVGVGIHFWESLDREIEWARMGANLIVHSADILLFSRKLDEDVRRFREAVGDETVPASGLESAI